MVGGRVVGTAGGTAVGSVELQSLYNHVLQDTVPELYTYQFASYLLAQDVQPILLTVKVKVVSTKQQTRISNVNTNIQK